jgi:acyl dehydratase
MVSVGDELPEVTGESSLVASVMYAAASGDYNPLHYDQSFAEHVSPTKDIIAHGMMSMGLASRALTGWAGGPEMVASIEVRLTKPWPLGTTSTFGGTVTEVGEETATVSLWGRNESGDEILKGTGVTRI